MSGIAVAPRGCRGRVVAGVVRDLPGLVGLDVADDGEPDALGGQLCVFGGHLLHLVLAEQCVPGRVRLPDLVHAVVLGHRQEPHLGGVAPGGAARLVDVGPDGGEPIRDAHGHRAPSEMTPRAARTAKMIARPA